MNRTDLISNWTHLFLDSHGRIGRRDFWLGSAVLLVVGNLLHLVFFFGTLASFTLFYCWVCLFSKRLHDIGKSGWVQIAPHLINALCIVVGVAMGAFGLIVAFFSGRTGAATGALFGGVMAWAGLLLTVFGIAMINTLIFMLWLGLSPTRPEVNRFGPPQDSVI